MITYYDTGVILKLYTNEPESEAVRHFVVDRNEPLYLNSLHRSEFVSAFRLKVFRKELTTSAATNSINDMEDDISNGIIRLVEVDWDLTWRLCRQFADSGSTTTGCRTLDSLHIACARSQATRTIVTRDKRQARLAKKIGMQVLAPG